MARGWTTGRTRGRLTGVMRIKSKATTILSITIIAIISFSIGTIFLVAVPTFALSMVAVVVVTVHGSCAYLVFVNLVL